MHILYTYFKSSTAWRARIAVNLKKIPIQYKFVNLFEGEQKSETYVKINPNQGVPSLIFPNGQTLVESMAIIQYLNQLHPSPCNFFPGDIHQRAQIRSFCELVNSGIHPYQNLRLLQKIQNQLDPNFDRVKWCSDWVKRGAKTMETILATNKKKGISGRYVFGDQITAADILFYPQVSHTKDRFKVDITAYPHVFEVWKNLNEHPDFVKASPRNQPDYDQKVQ